MQLTVSLLSEFFINSTNIVLSLIICPRNLDFKHFYLNFTLIPLLSNRVNHKAKPKKIQELYFTPAICSAVVHFEDTAVGGVMVK